MESVSVSSLAVYVAIGTQFLHRWSTKCEKLAGMLCLTKLSQWDHRRWSQPTQPCKADQKRPTQDAYGQPWPVHMHSHWWCGSDPRPQLMYGDVSTSDHIVLMSTPREVSTGVEEKHGYLW